MRFRVLGVFALALCAPQTVLAAGDALTAFYAKLSLVKPTVSSEVVCHGIGCRFRTEIPFSSADKARLSALMAAGRPSPVAERRALAAAVAWFDRRIAPAAGTSHRIARAGAHESGDPGQMDCIDTTSNNTGLFLVLDQLGLLRHHRVDGPVSRGLLFDGRMPHTTAVLAEKASGRRWAIDNWTHKYGELPDVEPLEQWQGEN
jgi:hypothetical protein